MCVLLRRLALAAVLLAGAGMSLAFAADDSNGAAANGGGASAAGAAEPQASAAPPLPPPPAPASAEPGEAKDDANQADTGATDPGSKCAEFPQICTGQ